MPASQTVQSAMANQHPSPSTVAVHAAEETPTWRQAQLPNAWAATGAPNPSAAFPLSPGVGGCKQQGPSSAGPGLAFPWQCMILAQPYKCCSSRTCCFCGVLHVCMQVRIAVVGGGTGEILEAAGVKPAFTATKVRYLDADNW